jgi:hypothetical protein
MTLRSETQTRSTRIATAAGGLTLLLAVIAAGCGGGEKAAPIDSTRPAAPSESLAPTAADVVPPMFRTLRWIQGRWRGSDSAQLVFYEEYRFVDDSTIAMRSFSDSMFSTPTDSAVVRLRGGRVENVSANAAWVATRFDGNSVSFAPVRGARNHFVWERATTGWRAVLFPPIGRGTSRDRVYHMTPMLR